MKSWSHPAVPSLPGTAPIPRIHDTSTGTLKNAGGTGETSLYVCGITPYDATHLGHANTYLAYDTLVRLWLDHGTEMELDAGITPHQINIADRLVELGWEHGRNLQTRVYYGAGHAYAQTAVQMDEVLAWLLA